MSLVDGAAAAEQTRESAATAHKGPTTPAGSVRNGSAFQGSLLARLASVYTYDARFKPVPTVAVTVRGETLQASGAASSNRVSPRYDDSHFLRVPRQFVVTKGGETSRIWRAVEPDELKDLLGSGQYRPGPGNEGKYFFSTKAQAEVLANEILPGRRFCITSGCIDSSVLAKIEKIYPAGEGQAWFIPIDLLPFMKNIVNNGRVG